MNARLQLARKGGVNEAMAFEPGLAAEGIRDDENAEMGLAAGPVSGVALMTVGFVQYLQALRSEGCGKLFLDCRFDVHAHRPLTPRAD